VSMRPQPLVSVHSRSSINAGKVRSILRITSSFPAHSAGTRPRPVLSARVPLLRRTVLRVPLLDDAAAPALLSGRKLQAGGGQAVWTRPEPLVSVHTKSSIHAGKVRPILRITPSFPSPRACPRATRHLLASRVLRLGVWADVVQ